MNMEIIFSLENTRQVGKMHVKLDNVLKSDFHQRISVDQFGGSSRHQLRVPIFLIENCGKIEMK